MVWTAEMRRRGSLARRIAKFGSRTLPDPDVRIPTWTVNALFLDRQGGVRPVTLDCRPAQFVRLEHTDAGLIRRTWQDRGEDRQGRALYVELQPEPYRFPSVKLKHSNQ